LVIVDAVERTENAMDADAHTPADGSGTRDAAAKDARAPHDAERPPTPGEEQTADAMELKPSVAEHEQEMARRGAEIRGEGAIE
jgi:hypothetical protein